MLAGVLKKGGEMIVRLVVHASVSGYARLTNTFLKIQLRRGFVAPQFTRQE